MEILNKCDVCIKRKKKMMSWKKVFDRQKFKKEFIRNIISPFIKRKRIKYKITQFLILLFKISFFRCFVYRAKKYEISESKEKKKDKERKKDFSVKTIQKELARIINHRL